MSTRVEDGGGAPQPKLLELRDLLQLPLWLMAKPLYAAAPMSVALRVATARGRLDWVSSGRHGELVTKLERHLGQQMGEAEVRRIARRHIESRRRYRVARLWPLVRDIPGDGHIAVSGLDHLDRALARGRGVVIMSAHFGHCRLIKPILRSRGRPAKLVGMAGDARGPEDGRPSTRLATLVHTRMLRLPRASTLDERWNRAVGTDLATGINVREYLRALARNDILIILSDGGRSLAGLPFSALGMDVRLASGAVGLARRAGAAALPAFVVDDPGSCTTGLHLIIGRPLDIQVTDDVRADLEANLGRFAAAYDETARAYPHNWHWAWVRDGVWGNPLLGNPLIGNPLIGNPLSRSPPPPSRRRPAGDDP